ncbi:hypothetical protein [Rhizobiales bacterium 3FA27D7]|jgi:hypothetical protein|uniref:hypothetical protein n=1 Tax=Mesorhizobium sp. 2RAF21 TaxID=3232995 RepID=UPI0010F56B7C
MLRQTEFSAAARRNYLTSCWRFQLLESGEQTPARCPRPGASPVRPALAFYPPVELKIVLDTFALMKATFPRSKGIRLLGISLASLLMEADEVESQLSLRL